MLHEIHPHIFDNTFKVTTGIEDDDNIFYFEGNALLLKQIGNSVELPRYKDLRGSCTDGIFLFALDGTHCYLMLECAELNENSFCYHEIKSRNPASKKEIDWAGGVAFQLRNWYVNNKYCGKCGTGNSLKINERALVCPNCQTTVYPNIPPAIAVAILCRDKILLARGQNFPEGFYSLVAGYVDIGETIEEAVIREVKEEVGVDVENVRYYGNQPWPFSGSMMIGFVADADDRQEIVIEEEEIAAADWFTRDELPDYPPERSISGEIISKFKHGELK